MKFKFLALACILLLVLTVSPTVLAVGDDDVPSLSALPYYGEFSGLVKSIATWSDPDGIESSALLVLLENKVDGVTTQVNFIVDQSTQMLTDNELKEGSQATGFYRSDVPSPTILPARHHALLLAVNVPEGQFIKAARFDDELISDDKTLKLNIGEKTEIVLNNGEAAPEGLKLGGLRLAVFYGESTRSMPAITTPIRIIVLALTDAVPLLPGETDEIESAFDGMPIVVEGELLADAPPVYVKEDGTAMIPLRAVVEVLGYKVGWHDGRKVSLNGATVLIIDSLEYTALDGSTVKLKVAPELYESRTYVPLAFFKEVLKLNNAYIFEGQVVINNEEEKL